MKEFIYEPDEHSWFICPECGESFTEEHLPTCPKCGHQFIQEVKYNGGGK